MLALCRLVASSYDLFVVILENIEMVSWEYNLRLEINRYYFSQHYLLSISNLLWLSMLYLTGIIFFNIVVSPQIYKKLKFNLTMSMKVVSEV